MSKGDYAGDVSPAEAWEILSKDPQSVLIDVRTDAEWYFVGLPDLAGIGKKTHCVAWQHFTDMRLNDDFVAETRAIGVQPEQTLLFICRSGQRSRHAAIALTEAGYKRCYNVAEGFEGAHDSVRHRGTVGGWKVADLPWIQG